MFNRNFNKYLMDNWNRKMEPGNDSLGRVSGYPAQFYVKLTNKQTFPIYL